MKKETYLYVAEDATYATGNQAAFRASEYIGASTDSSTTTSFYFWPWDKSTYGGVNVTPDSFTLTHTEDGHIEILKGVANAMQAGGGFVVVQDDLGTSYTSDGSSLGTFAADIKYTAIASTGTPVVVNSTGVSITTVDA